MKISPLLSVCLAAVLLAGAAQSADTFTVSESQIADPKAVFATVESVKTVPARARIGGTIAALSVKEGDRVTPGQVIATVGDDKLVAQLRAIEAQAAKAKQDLERAEDLARRGVMPRAQLDAARAANSVAQSQLRAQQQQLAEGEVLAPSDGRILSVPVTAGSVVLPGDPIAVIAAEDYLLRLRLPERHARYLKAGDEVQLAAQGKPATIGRIRLVYPQIENGRIVADAEIDGLGDYFVGERVRVIIASAPRIAFLVPARFVATRFGVDYVRVQQAGGAMEAPVQRGDVIALQGSDERLELLSGVRAGDILVQP